MKTVTLHYLLRVICFCLVAVSNGTGAQASEPTAPAARAAQLEKIKVFTEQIQSEPKSVLLYAKRGQCYVQLKDWDNALSDTNMALSLDPKMGLLYTARGKIYNGMGKHNLEELDLERAVALAPTDVQCLESLGVCYGLYHEPLKSNAVLTRAIAIAPKAKKVDLYLMRAENFKTLKDFSKANDDLKMALNLEPGSKEAIVVKNEIDAARTRDSSK